MNSLSDKQNSILPRNNRRNTIFDMKLGIMRERDKFDTDIVKIRNIDTKLLKKEGVSYSKMVERNSHSKNRKTIMSMDTLNAPHIYLNSSSVIHETSQNNIHSSVALSKSSHRKKSQSQKHLKNAIKEVYRSTGIEVEDLSIEKRILRKLKNNQYNPLKDVILEKFRKSRQSYLDYLIGMRIFKQGVLSLFCRFIIKLIDEGIEHRPDLWRKLLKQYKFNSNKEKKTEPELYGGTGILSDVQIIEKNLSSCLNFCVRFDDRKINRLQNALKSNNFEVKDFETYYQMNSRINQIPLEDPELKGNDKLFAEKKMTRRIIRLKSRNPVIDHYQKSLKNQDKDALKTQETLWAKSGDLFSSNPALKTNDPHLNQKSLLIKKKNRLRTRSFQSFEMKHNQKMNSLPTIMVNKMSESVESELIKMHPSKVIKEETNSAEESVVQYSYSQNVEDKQKINIFKPRKIWFGKKKR